MMGKHSKRKIEGKSGKILGTKSKVQKPKPKQKAKRHLAGVGSQQQSFVPYGSNDRILLIGEGDFSFGRSLVEQYGCRNVLATCLDTQVELERKYPQATAAVEHLKEHGQKVAYGVDATKLSQKEIRRPPLPPLPLQEDPVIQDEDGDDDEDFEQPLQDAQFGHPDSQKHQISADERGWDIISFNFPHVGGKSTDVNRQVRYNQSLLVSFFKASLPLLTLPSKSHPAGGVILITLFEGEPYTLWNVKDLGRHAGLRAERSWKFESGSYPGYRHARTLGNIDGESAWKGEQRSARTYAFVRKDVPADTSPFASFRQPSKKRQRQNSDDESEA